MSSIFRSNGLSKQIGDATDLKNRITFLKKRFRRLRGNRPGLTTGIFLGVEALEDLLRGLKSGHYDGLQICYGQNELNNLVLIAREVTFDTSESDQSQIIQHRGSIYTSTQSIFLGAVVATEPPVAECPPLKICNADE